MMLSADDHLAILNLYATYNHLADGEDPLAYGNCHTTNGKLMFNGREIGSSRAEIVEFRRRNIAKRTGRVRRHFSNNIYLETIGLDEVKGRSYMQAFDFTPDGVSRLTHSGNVRGLDS